jgi:hypothetical protein
MAGVSPSTKTFTPKQGQYLAFIHLYTRLHRRPPAETDMQEYFRAGASLTVGPNPSESLCRATSLATRRTGEKPINRPIWAAKYAVA